MEDYEKNGTQFRTSHIKNYFPNYIYPKSNGASLTFKFTGNSFGLLGNIKEGSSLTVILDGKTEVKLNGSSKSELLEYPVFKPLSNTVFFKSAHTDGCTVVWNDEIDIDPESLYNEGISI